MEKERYYPEGYTEEELHIDMDVLKQAIYSGQIIEGIVRRCDIYLNLFISLGEYIGMIPWSETSIGIRDGSTKKSTIISLVGKTVAFKIVAINESTKPATIVLSRRLAQEEALLYLMNTLKPGDILPGIVTHLTHFGAFVDIGCGISSMIAIENISVARIFHPSERFSHGQKIFVVVLAVERDKRRVVLTHKELLGTWLQNCEKFCIGDTVMGVVRNIKPYGMFIELTPNLSGLSESNDAYLPGDTVIVNIKTIVPSKMKMKLSIIDRVPGGMQTDQYEYYIADKHIGHWIYSPPDSERVIERFFS